MTTFQMPLGAKRLTSLTMGGTNSSQTMQGDSTHIFQEEIPEITVPFIDDVAIKGPVTRYELPDGTYETIPQNPGIRRFVWEHLCNFVRVCQRMKAYGGTFNGKKLKVIVLEVDIVGHICSYEGHIPDPSKVQVIKDWPICETLTQVRAFLRTCGILRIFIKDFSHHARPLVNLTRKGVPFEFGEEQLKAMNYLKNAVINSPTLRPINYTCGREVIAAIDSSSIAGGFVLLQIGEDRKRYPARFGSIAWNERESRYSQPKIELYGVFHALRALRTWLIGLDSFMVEADAQSIRGMINNPDIQPNATINHWIAGILLFDFTLVHVPSEKHTVADGLSQSPCAAEDEPENSEHEDWIGSTYSFTSELLEPSFNMTDAPTVIPLICTSRRQPQKSTYST
jgi:hypothetical protein